LWWKSLKQRLVGSAKGKAYQIQRIVLRLTHVSGAIQTDGLPVPNIACPKYFTVTFSDQAPSGNPKNINLDRTSTT
jgi:hypothetical protein